MVRVRELDEQTNGQLILDRLVFTQVLTIPIGTALTSFRPSSLLAGRTPFSSSPVIYESTTPRTGKVAVTLPPIPSTLRWHKRSTSSGRLARTKSHGVICTRHCHLSVERESLERIWYTPPPHVGLGFLTACEGPPSPAIWLRSLVSLSKGL